VTFDSEHVMADLLAVVCEQWVRTAMLTHATPFGRELIQRMCQPVVGDLVVVRPVLNPDRGDFWRRVGVLAEVSVEANDTTKAFTLWHPIKAQPTTTTWSNVDCVAVPVATRGMQCDKPVEGLFLNSATAIPLSLWSLKSLKSAALGRWPGDEG
jgi:hypothetical protein